MSGKLPTGPSLKIRTICPQVVYRAQTAHCFAPATVAALEAQQLDAVVLLSARTAATYASLARVHNQLENIQNICHLCLSDTIAGELRALRPRIIRVAAHPTIEELLALAGHAAKPLP